MMTPISVPFPWISLVILTALPCFDCSHYISNMTALDITMTSVRLTWLWTYDEQLDDVPIGCTITTGLVYSGVEVHTVLLSEDITQYTIEENLTVWEMYTSCLTPIFQNETFLQLYDVNDSFIPDGANTSMTSETCVPFVTAYDPWNWKAKYAVIDSGVLLFIWIIAFTINYAWLRRRTYGPPPDDDDKTAEEIQEQDPTRESESGARVNSAFESDDDTWSDAPQEQDDFPSGVTKRPKIVISGPDATFSPTGSPTEDTQTYVNTHALQEQPSMGITGPEAILPPSPRPMEDTYMYIDAPTLQEQSGWSSGVLLRPGMGVIGPEATFPQSPIPMEETYINTHASQEPGEWSNGVPLQPRMGASGAFSISPSPPEETYINTNASQEQGDWHPDAALRPRIFTRPEGNFLLSPSRIEETYANTNASQEQSGWFTGMAVRPRMSASGPEATFSPSLSPLEETYANTHASQAHDGRSMDQAVRSRIATRGSGTTFSPTGNPVENTQTYFNAGFEC